MEPKVTVLIAHKDYQEYLGAAIDSCVRQTYDCHICIVDDGSEEPEIVLEIIGHIFNYDCTVTEEEFGKIYRHEKYTVVLLNENHGPSTARNVGISVTQDFTDYYQILDADDIMRPNKVKTLLEAMSLDPNIGVAYGDITCLNTETMKENREFREPFSNFRLLQECIVHSGAMVSKYAILESLENDSVYDVKMRTCEDYDLWIRIAEKFMIVHIAEDLTLVRVQPKNSTATVDNSIWVQNWNRIRDKVAKRETAKQ